MPTTNTSNLLKSGNFKINTVDRQIGRFEAPTPSSFSNIKTGIAKNLEINAKEKKKENDTGFFSGGALSDFFDVLSAGRFAITGFMEGKLEDRGTLKKTGANLAEGVKERKSNIDLLQRVGAETGKGGLLTGNYTPTASVWGNFIREIPSTALGLAADLFLDPIVIGSKLGVFKGLTKGTKEAAIALKTKSPAVGRMVSAIEQNDLFQSANRFFVTRGGQSEHFKNLDRNRIISEALGGEKATKLSSPVIESPQVMQQRLNQILKGGVTTKNELKVIAEPLRKEIDESGKIISELSPDLLRPEVFESNKGKYVSTIYKSNILDKQDGELLNNLFLRGGEIKAPGGQFKKRKFFGDKILDGGLEKSGIYKSKFDDFFDLSHDDKLKVLTKAQDDTLPSFRKEEFKSKPVKLSEESVIRTEERVRTLKNLNNPLEKTRVKITEQIQKFLTPSQVIKINKIKLINLEKELPLEKIFKVDSKGIISKLSDIPKRKAAESIFRKYIKQVDEALPEINIRETLDVKIENTFVNLLENNIDNSIRANTKKLSKLVSKRETRAGELSRFEQLKGLDKIAANVKRAVSKNGNVLSFKDFETQASAKNLADLMTGKVRQSLGEIKEAGLPVTKTLDDITKAKIRLQFFDDLVESKAVSSVRNDTIGHSYQLPESPLLGRASSGWMKRADVETIQGNFFKVPTELDKSYGALLRLWKAGKTAYNPATISRNDITNFMVLNPLGGLAPWRLDVYNRAIKGMGKQSDAIWNEFRSVGGGLSSQASAELVDRATDMYKSTSDTAKGIKKMFPKIKDFHKKVVDFYGNQDTFFKFANFIKGKEDGLSPLQSMQRANMYLVDYTEMPNFIKWARKSPFGAPFISFTYGVTKPFAKTLLNNPDKLSAYYKSLRAIQSLNPYGESEEDRAKIEAVLPENLKGMKALRMPYKDKNGNSVFLDLRYLLPFNILEMADNDGALTKLGVPAAIQPSNPLTTIIGDLIRNKSSFNARPIVPAASSRWEASMAVTDYIQKQLLPSFSVGVPTKVEGKLNFGGYSSQKIIDTIMKRPTFPASEPKDPTSAVLEAFFGLKNVPVDIEQEARFRKIDKLNKIREVTTQIIRIKHRKTLTAEEKTKEIAKLKEKLKKFRVQQ